MEELTDVVAVKDVKLPETGKDRVVKRPKKPTVVVDGDHTVLNDYFRVPTGTYKILRRNIKRGVNSLLLGPTGVGKTELAAALAETEGLPLTIFDMGTMTDPIMSLVGTHAIKVTDSRTESRFIQSRFSQVIQHPGVVMLDEISRASAAANNLLFPVLDFRRSLSMEYSFDNSEPIKVHPQCVFVATANVGSQYTGTHKLDRALVDRFMMIEIDPLNDTQVKQIVHFHYPTLGSAKVDKMVKTFFDINKAHDDFQLGFSLSLRHLKMIAELASDNFSLYDGFYCICKGIGSKEGLKTLDAILKSLQ